MPHIHLSKHSIARSLLFILGALVGFFLVYRYSTLLDVTSVSVIGASKEQKKVIAEFLLKKNMFFLNEKDVALQVRSRFPALTVVDIEKRYPGLLTLTIASEKPFAYLVTDNGYVSVSQKGTVLEKVRGKTTPEPAVNFYQPIRHNEYQMGQVVTYAQLQKALLFIRALTDEGFRVETVAIDSVDMIACKTRGFTVAFSQKRDTELQKYELRQLVKQLKIGTLRVKRLDLRFDKPVVELQSP